MARLAIGVLGLLTFLSFSPSHRTAAEPLPNNGCPKGWIYYDFRCYHFVADPRLNWEEAWDFCRNDTGGAYLVAIETMAELSYLEKYTTQRTKQLGNIARQQWWTGGYLYMDYDSSWVWKVPGAEGGVVPFGLLREAWYPGEPNDENGDENYISLRYDSVGLGLDDKSDWVQMGFICEKDPLVQV